MWNRFSALFDCLPLAAIIGSKIFCCHGGLSPDLKTVDQIESIRRPYPINTLTGLVNDLLWSDPSRVNICLARHYVRFCLFCITYLPCSQISICIIMVFVLAIFITFVCTMYTHLLTFVICILTRLVFILSFFLFYG